MSDTEQGLKEDLLAAYGRDLPLEEAFTKEVLTTVSEEEGGEGEISVAAPRANRSRWFEAAIAACVVGVILILANGRGPERADPHLAGGFPESSIGVRMDPDLTVKIDGKGRITLWGETVEISVLHETLATAVRSIRKSKGERPVVVIEADGDAPWSSIHAVLTGLDKAGASHSAVAVRGPNFTEPRYLVLPFPTSPARRKPAPPGPQPSPEPILLELQRSVEEKTTRVYFDGEEFGRDEAGLSRLRDIIVSLNSRRSIRGGVRLRAWAAVPLRQVVRVVSNLASSGVSNIPIDLNAQAFLTVFVSLRPKDDGTILFLGEERTRYEMTEGLAALAKRIRKHKADGRNPHGFLSARTYIDREAVEKVMDVFEAEGVEDVVRLN